MDTNENETTATEYVWIDSEGVADFHLEGVSLPADHPLAPRLAEIRADIIARYLACWEGREVLDCRAHELAAERYRLGRFFGVTIAPIEDELNAEYERAAEQAFGYYPDWEEIEAAAAAEELS